MIIHPLNETNDGSYSDLYVRSGDVDNNVTIEEYFPYEDYVRLEIERFSDQTIQVYKDQVYQASLANVLDDDTNFVSLVLFKNSKDFVIGGITPTDPSDVCESCFFGKAKWLQIWDKTGYSSFPLNTNYYASNSLIKL